MKKNRLKEKVRPFLWGMQYFDWTYNNCSQCKRSGCNIERTLSFALSNFSGIIDKKIAKYIGYFKNLGRYNWLCPHRKIKEKNKRRKK